MISDIGNKDTGKEFDIIQGSMNRKFIQQSKPVYNH